MLMLKCRSIIAFFVFLLVSFSAHSQSCFYRTLDGTGIISIPDDYMFICYTDEKDWTQEERRLAEKFFSIVDGHFVPTHKLSIEE
jgi:hypothetical protein